MKDYTLSEIRAINEAYLSSWARMSNKRREEWMKTIQKINSEIRQKISTFSVGDEVEFYLQQDARFSSDGRTKPWGRVYAPYVKAGRGIIEKIGNEYTLNNADSDRIYCQFDIKVLEYYTGRYQGNDFGMRKTLHLDVGHVKKIEK